MKKTSPPKVFAVVAAPFFGESVAAELQPLCVCETGGVCTALKPFLHLPSQAVFAS